MLGLPCRHGSNSFRPAVNYMAAMSAATIGVAGFYRPRMPPTWFAADGTEAALSVYDTTPLKATLEELVDFDLINRGEVRLSVGAVNVCKGTSTYFDTKNTLIHSEHIRASGALPPGFPPVMIDGEYYWDGGVVTNTPINYVSDERPLTTARIIQVDTFNAQGQLPRNLGQVSERAKDIQYASKARFNIEQVRELGELAAAGRELVERLPPGLKSDPNAQKLAAACDERSWLIIRLINTRPSRSGSVKDFEFSRGTIEEAWTAGVVDVRHSVSGWDKIRPEEAGPEVKIYRPTETLPSSGQASGRKKAKLEPVRS